MINPRFKPLSISPIEIPLPARLVSDVQSMIAKTFELAYFDGLVEGVLLTLLFVLSMRSRVSLGLFSPNHAVDVAQPFRNDGKMVALSQTMKKLGLKTYKAGTA